MVTNEIDDLTIEESSGNVFADLDLPNAEDLNTKLRLCVYIRRAIAKKALSQAEAALLLGVNQPKVSALQRFKIEGFSVERLMNFATKLDYDVVIQLRPKMRESKARVIVEAAA
jgi:predicted XRE-type DNA-binding protein